MAGHSTWDHRAQGLPLERSPAVFFFCAPSEERQTETGDTRQLYTPQDRGKLPFLAGNFPQGNFRAKKTKIFGFFFLDFFFGFLDELKKCFFFQKKISIKKISGHWPATKGVFSLVE